MKPSELWLELDLVEKSRTVCQTIPKFQSQVFASLDAVLSNSGLRWDILVLSQHLCIITLITDFFTQYVLLQTWQFLYIIQRPDDHLSLFCVF